MIKCPLFHTLLLLLSLSIFAQEKTVATPEIKISYLDSIKNTFVKDKMASCVDSLWMKELTSLDLYNALEKDIKTINLDEKVDFELPTELLKSRLKAMDAKSPFNIEYNQGLENIIKSFLKNRKKSFERLMAFSEYYFPIFEAAFAKQNVPLEIKYLAVVESALNPRAVSRVGATGLWQFMYQTGKQYNLNIDSYVDDRSDPLKASEAAAQYMSNMYKIFGDWDLVLASYNSGPGNVAKAIRRSGGQQNYWNIRKNLPQETQGYVPAFLATMYIYEYHAAHGIKPERAVIKQFATDTIMIKKQMSFKQISDLIEIPIAQLQLLNPQYKLNVVPAYIDTPHFLTLPSQKVALFTSNEDKIYAYVQHEFDKRERPFTSRQRAFASRDSLNSGTSIINKTKFHKVKRGDSLIEIATRYNVSLSEIKKWNKLKSNKAPLGKNLKIIISENVVIKNKKETQVAQDIKEIPAVVFVSHDEAKGVKESKEYKVEKLVTVREISTIYKVKKGDNLGFISNKYEVTVADIKKWNLLKNNKLTVGKSIKIIKNESVVTLVKKALKLENNVITESNKKENKQEETDKKESFYTVQLGDNLSVISKKYNVSIEELKKWNNLSDNAIQLESKLKIAAIANIKEDNSPQISKLESKPTEYTIQKGDNLSLIAKKNAVTVAELKSWNNLTEEEVKAGAKIIVSKKSHVDTNIASVEKNTKNEIASKEKRYVNYYVQKGDSLFSIAKKYPGITISDIKKWNGIRGNELKPGMKLKING